MKLGWLVFYVAMFSANGALLFAWHGLSAMLLGCVMATSGFGVALLFGSAALERLKARP